MGEAVTRLGDNCTGHDCHSPRPTASASEDVYIEGIEVVRQTDAYESHSCGPSSHAGVQAVGSSTVFVNGLAICRVGDAVSCGSVATATQETVYAGA